MSRAVLVVGLITAALCVAACESRVGGRMSHGEADALVAALDEAAIPGRVERDGQGWQVTVDAAYREPAEAVWEARRACPPHADDDDVDESVLLGPSPSTLAAREARALGRGLEHALNAVGGVVCARAALGLEVGRLGRPDPTPRGSLLVAIAPDADHAEIERVAEATARGLNVALDEVVFTEVATAPAPRLARVGPWQVSPASVPTLRGVLGAAVLLVVGAAVAIASLALRRKRASA